MAMVDKTPMDRTRRAATGTGLAALPRLVPAMVAGTLLMASVVLPGFMFETVRDQPVSGLGPAAWPKTILFALAVFSALWLVLELRVLARAGRISRLRAPDEEEAYHYGKAIGGLGLVLAFGWLLPMIGFALSTALFLLIWCLYGGQRNPVVLTLVPIVGTGGLLWMFMGLALMPLSRGVGPFESFSVWLLTLIGIY